jgi:hypothetical protein
LSYDYLGFLILEAIVMRTKVFVLSALSAILSMCFSLGLRSQEAIDVESLEQKTVKADLIVIGRVIDVKTRWDETRSKIYTFVSLALEEAIKGHSSKKNIMIRVPGGEVDEIGTFVPEMASFRKGERALVFLIRDLRSDNFFVLYGQFGKYEIEQDNMVMLEEAVPLPEFLNKIRKYIPK